MKGPKTQDEIIQQSSNTSQVGSFGRDFFVSCGKNDPKNTQIWGGGDQTFLAKKKIGKFENILIYFQEFSAKILVKNQPVLPDFDKKISQNWKK